MKSMGAASQSVPVGRDLLLCAEIRFLLKKWDTVSQVITMKSVLTYRFFFRFIPSSLAVTSGPCLLQRRAYHLSVLLAPPTFSIKHSHEAEQGRKSLGRSTAWQRWALVMAALHCGYFICLGERQTLVWILGSFAIGYFTLLLWTFSGSCKVVIRIKLYVKVINYIWKDQNTYNLLILCSRKPWRAAYPLESHDLDGAGLVFVLGFE